MVAYKATAVPLSHRGIGASAGTRTRNLTIKSRGHYPFVLRTQVFSCLCVLSLLSITLDLLLQLFTLILYHDFGIFTIFRFSNFMIEDYLPRSKDGEILRHPMTAFTLTGLTVLQPLKC